MKSHGRSLANDSGSVVRWLNPKHAKGQGTQTQIQSLPGMTAEAGNRGILLGTEGHVREPVWCPSPSPQQCEVPALQRMFLFPHFEIHTTESEPFLSGTSGPLIPLFTFLFKGSTQVPPHPAIPSVNGQLPWLGTESTEVNEMSLLPVCCGERGSEST